MSPLPRHRPKRRPFRSVVVFPVLFLLPLTVKLQMLWLGLGSGVAHLWPWTPDVDLDPAELDLALGEEPLDDLDEYSWG